MNSSFSSIPSKKWCSPPRHGRSAGGGSAPAQSGTRPHTRDRCTPIVNNTDRLDLKGKNRRLTSNSAPPPPTIWYTLSQHGQMYSYKIYNIHADRLDLKGKESGSGSCIPYTDPKRIRIQNNCGAEPFLVGSDSRLLRM